MRLNILSPSRPWSDHLLSDRLFLGHTLSCHIRLHDTNATYRRNIWDLPRARPPNLLVASPTAYHARSHPLSSEPT
jgi:hypothetical protein